eukprot:COSAG02_NODE_4833_length_4924_cov_14.701175_1_plen_43_part_00
MNESTLVRDQSRSFKSYRYLVPHTRLLVKPSELDTLRIISID